MKWLRLLRAPEMAFWTGAVLALAILLITAAALGSRPGAAAAAPGGVAVVGATKSKSVEQVLALQSLMPSGIAAGTDAAALAAYAHSVEVTAEQGAQVRTAEGATSSDDLLSEFGSVQTLAMTLTQVAGTPVTAVSLRTQIGLHVTRLGQLAAGAPAPALPDVAPADMLSGSRATPAAPAAPGVHFPTTPTVH